MGFANLSAWRIRSAERAVSAARLEAALSVALALGPDDALAVNEIACTEPGCPDVETIVLVMRRDEPTRALKLNRTMDGLGPPDIAALVRQDRERRIGHSEGT